MKVSVIMPAYNAEKTIKDAILSVLNQSYKDFELIIVNDGSKDSTEFILNDYAQHDSRIKAISISNSGVSNARNIGIEKCKGEYVTFIDSDDKMEPEFIEAMVNHMTDDCDIVCCGYGVVTNEGKYLFDQKIEAGKYEKNRYFQGIAMLQENNAFNALWNKLFRLSIIREHNLKMNPEVKMGEDFLFIVDYMNKMNSSICCISDALYHYTLSLNGAQATLNKDDTVEKRIERINYLVPLYEREGYPMDSIYDEQLRYIYSSLRDNSFDKEKLNSLLKINGFEKLKTYKPDKNKMRLFKMILFSKSWILIKLFITSFACFKRVIGKSYKWS